MALVNPNELRLDSVSSSLVKSYNAKPFMCRSTGNYYRSERYFGVEADMHKWGVVALQGFNMLKAQVPQMLLRCGLLIQAEGNDEMPEQMLAATYLSGISQSAPDIPVDALDAASRGGLPSDRPPSPPPAGSPVAAPPAAGLVPALAFGSASGHAHPDGHLFQDDNPMMC
uniref:Protein ENHANCED DISEASE RESISTANCE 2 C-terminal domain-containing protein n=1 Tax=Haptolina ericina TaxID=156174 RepID=A0A7S3FGS6_9EUKA